MRRGDPDALPRGAGATWPGRRARGERLLGATLVVPALLLIGVVIAYPLAYALYLSFHDVGIRTLRGAPAAFVGFQNYRAVLHDALFWASLGHTVVFAGVSVALEVVLGLAIALAMNQAGVRLAVVTQALILLPWALPPVVNGIMWSFLFNSKYGYVNAVLLQLGLVSEPLQWVTDPHRAMAVVILAYVWRTTPFAVLLFHAALRSIPPGIFEAAEVDGAGARRRFWSITLPLLLPTVVVLLVLRTVFSFMVFDEILAITDGGPGDSTWVATWYIYSSAFRYMKLGAGSAGGYLLSLGLGLLAFLYMRTLHRPVEY
jgi:multiple sugar transport system permease protein